eukprot:6475724-Amphidinium_carterae.1
MNASAATVPSVSFGVESQNMFAHTQDIGGMYQPMLSMTHQQQQQQQHQQQQLHMSPPGIPSRRALVASAPSNWSTNSGSGAGPNAVGGAMSWCVPSQSEQIEACAGSMHDPELRKERTRLPEWDVSSSSDPVSVLTAFESWILRCGVSMSTWCRQPSIGSKLWQCTVEESTRAWMIWSLQTPYERKIDMLSRPTPGFTPVPFESQTSVEACLRAELLERLPRSVSERVVTENKTRCSEILELAMRQALPSYHTVRVTLLDAVEASGTKCSGYPQLLTSLRSWSRSIKLCMSRYNITPEPRRLWLSMLGRISTLKNDPMFASILERHMSETGVKTWQTLDNVLSFMVAIEAEVESIVQDQSGLSGQQNQGTRSNKSQANSASTTPQPTSQANAACSSGGQGGAPASKNEGSAGAGKDKNKGVEVCKHWNTKTGCRFGAACRNKHPYARVTDNLCFVCGAQEH